MRRLLGTALLTLFGASMVSFGFIHLSPIEPARVAEAILDAAETPTRAKRVGFMAKVNATAAMLAPGLADRMAAKQVDKMQYDEPPRHPEGTLRQPSEATGVAGRTRGTGGKEPK